VLVCAIIVGGAALTQTLVWAFAHYTDIRMTVIESDATNQPPAVVLQPGATEARITADANSSLTQARDHASVDPNRALSKQDRWLRAVSDLAVLAGIIATVALNISLFQAIMIAAGGATPGVHKAVQAGAWAVALALLALPVQSVTPAFPVPGVFQGYDTLTRTVEMVHAGAAGAPGAFVYFSEQLVLPLIVLVGVVLIMFRFNAGIEAGVILTSVSELDEALDREMASMKIASARTPKAVGALNRAIGEPDEDASPPPPPDRSASGKKATAAHDEDHRRPI